MCTYRITLSYHHTRAYFNVCRTFNETCPVCENVFTRHKCPADLRLHQIFKNQKLRQVRFAQRRPALPCFRSLPFCRSPQETARRRFNCSFWIRQKLFFHARKKSRLEKTFLLAEFIKNINFPRVFFWAGNKTGVSPLIHRYDDTVRSI